MSKLIPDSWTDPQFLPAAYSLALLGLGLVCLVILLIRRQRWHGLPRQGVAPWHIGWLDINILFCLLFMWSLVVAPLTLRILPMPENPSVDMQIWQTAINGALLQVGMAVIFLFFWLMLPFDKRFMFNSRPMENGAVLGCALFYFLAFIPPRFGLEIVWSATLKQLDSLGLPIPMEEQSVVGLFDGSASPLAYIALVVLAGVLAPIVEELVFRAGLYRFLKGQVSRNGAMMISSAVFALLHMNVLVFPTLLLLGIALCLSYEVTGNIKVPMAFHALFNLNSILLIALQSSHVGM